MVEGHHADKLLESFQCSGLRKIKNGFDFGWKGHGLVLVDVMAEKCDGSDTKLALGKVDSQTMLINPLKELKEVCVVFLSRTADNENIIEIDENKIEATAHFVHKALERLSGILKAKRHTQELRVQNE